MANNTAKRYLDLEGLKTFYDLLVKKFADKSELVTLNTSVEGKADADDLSALDGRVTAVEGDIDAINTSLASKASSDDLSALDGRVQTVEGSVSTLSNTVTNLGTSVEGLESKVAELEGNLGDKNVIEGIKLNGTLVKPNKDKIVELTVEGGSAGTISMTTTQSLGGIPVGTIYENASLAKVLKDLLAPYVAFKDLKFSVNYNSTTLPSVISKEKGETVKINKLYASWTQGSRDIKNVSIYEGSVSLESYKNGTAPSSALLAEFNSSESNKIANPVEKSINEVVLNSNESKTFTVFVRDTDDLNGVTVEKATVTITNKAYIPVFYGVLPKSAYPFTVENITRLPRSQSFPTPVNFGNVPADSYIVVATQKPLKSAIDKSNQENIDLFDSEEKVLSTDLWSNEKFHVYRTYATTQLDNWTFKFTV